MSTKKKLYFLCTGNSCRSQIAEGWAKHYLGNTWEIQSAGIEAHGLNQQAVSVMADANIDISKQYSKIIDVNYLNNADLVITLCDNAAESCPITPPTVKRLHWGFADPAQVTGSITEQTQAFIEVRDAIKERIIRFANTGI